MKKILIDPVRNLEASPKRVFTRSLFLVVVISGLLATKIVSQELETQDTQEDVGKKINLPAQFVALSPEIADITIGHRQGSAQAWRVSDDHKNLVHNATGAEKDPLRWQTVIARDDNNNVISPLKTIHMSLDGAIMLLQDKAGNLYRYDSDKKNFFKLPASNAYMHNPTNNTFEKTTEPLHIEDLSIGNAHAIWALDKKTKIIYELNESSWLWFPRANGISVSAGGDGTVLIVDTKGIAHVYAQNNTWKALSGAELEKVAICNKSYIFGISSDGNLWRYDTTKKTKNKWQQIMGANKKPVTGIKNLKINPLGALFLFGDNGIIYSNGKQVVAIHERVIKTMKKMQAQKKAPVKTSRSVSIESATTADTTPEIAPESIADTATDLTPDTGLDTGSDVAPE